MRPAFAASATTLLFLLAALPTAAATQVPLADFEGTLDAVKVEGASGAKASFAIITGEVRARGDAAGVYGFVDVQDFSIDAIGTVTVIPAPGTALTPDQIRNLLGQHYTDATLGISDGATLFLSTEGASFTVDASSEFAFGIPIDPPADAGGTAIQLTPETSLALIGGLDIGARLVRPSQAPDAFLYVKDDNATITVKSDERPGGDEFEGNDFVFRLEYGDRTAELQGTADAAFVPLQGTVHADFTPASLSVATREMKFHKIQTAIQRIATNSSTADQFKLPSEMTAFIDSLTPVFNGALLGNPTGTASVEGDERDLGKVTLVRFENLRITGAQTEGRVAYEGDGRMVLAGDKIYTEKTVVGPRFFPLPVLSIVLWLFAALAIVLGFVLKPFFPPNPANAAPTVRWTAFALHVLGIVLGLLLWDFEMRSFFGTSILTMMFSGGGGAEAFGAVFALQSLGFSLAMLLFGLPIRFLFNSVLKLANLKRARGIGRGLAYVSAWGIGAAYLPVFLNVFVGLVADRLA